MAEAIDQGLVNSAKIDFSWINKGIESGQNYALAKQTIDNNMQNTQARLQEVALQRQSNEIQKGVSLSSAASDVMKELPGPVRKAKIAIFENLSRRLNVPVDPALSAAFSDPQYDEVLRKSLTDLSSTDPATRAAALQGMGQLGISLDGAKQFSDMANSVKKMQTEQAKVDSEAAAQAAKAKNEEQKAAEAERHNKKTETTDMIKANADMLKALKEGHAGSADKVLKVQERAGKIENDFDKAGGAFNNVITLLKRQNPFADRSAMDQALRAMGETRLTQYSLNSMRNLDNAQSNILLKLQNVFDGKMVFTPTIRAEAIKTITQMQRQRQAGLKEALSPIYNFAKSDVDLRDHLKNGEIIRPTNGAMFGENMSGAPSERNKVAPEAAAPTAVLSPGQKKAIAGYVKTNKKIKDIESQYLGGKQISVQDLKEINQLVGGQ